MFQPEGRNSRRLEHGRNSLFSGCCANVPATNPGNISQTSNYLLFFKVGTVGTVGTTGKNTCVPTLFQPLTGKPVVGTPCPRRQRWAQVTCPLDRSPRSLGGMWLAYYLDQGATLDAARDLARSTCRALYPETFPS
jgi:hypothetical protein